MEVFFRGPLGERPCGRVRGQTGRGSSEARAVPRTGGSVLGVPDRGLSIASPLPWPGSGVDGSLLVSCDGLERGRQGQDV